MTEDEDVEIAIQRVDLKKGELYGKACVLGKLVADRLVSGETIKSSLVNWWKPSENISFKVLGENMFLIEFVDIDDKERVLAGRPWVFQGSLFLVEDFDGAALPSKYTFDKAAFWIRMKNLPLACIGLEIGQKFGATVGVVEAVDTDSRGMAWGEFSAGEGEFGPVQTASMRTKDQH